MSLPAHRDPIPLADVQLTIRPAPLALAQTEREAIAANWAREQARNPHLWNGSAFLFDRAEIAGMQRANESGATIFVAEGAETDFATFLHWRSLGDADRRFTHVFPVGALITADDRLILGRMSPTTANAGKLYPPAGSFDTTDLVLAPDGSRHLDPLANIVREIREEIGLGIEALEITPQWLLFASGPKVRALVRPIRTAATSHQLAPAIAHHIANDPHQELSDVVFAEFGQRFPAETVTPYVNDLLAYLAATA